MAKVTVHIARDPRAFVILSRQVLELCSRILQPKLLHLNYFLRLLALRHIACGAEPFDDPAQSSSTAKYNSG